MPPFPFFHFSLFTACYQISSSGQAFELVTDTFPVLHELVENLSDGPHFDNSCIKYYGDCFLQYR